MGMTIEEAHEILSNGLFNAPSEHEWCIAFKIAIDTMQKYQKIEEIVTKWQNETDPKIKFARSNIERIKEVLDNEKID